MRIDSASRRLQTDGDVVMNPLKMSQFGMGVVGSSSNARGTAYALAENQGTFTGLYQNDLSASQYQRRVGT